MNSGVELFFDNSGLLNVSLLGLNLKVWINSFISYIIVLVKRVILFKTLVSYDLVRNCQLIHCENNKKRVIMYLVLNGSQCQGHFSQLH